MCKALKRLLTTHVYDVVTSALCDLFTALVMLPDFLVLDLHMPGINGFDVLERFVAEAIRVPVVVITGHDRPACAERVRALGAVDYLLKPLDESQLLAAIRKAIKVGEES
jgi:FixJ family two-component response regulator